jgi:hypothetical protein
VARRSVASRVPENAWTSAHVKYMLWLGRRALATSAPSQTGRNISSAATYTLVCSCEHTKVIESREKFHWPRLFQEDVVELTSEQLHWLMDGYDVWARPHKAVTFTHVS